MTDIYPSHLYDPSLFQRPQADSQVVAPNVHDSAKAWLKSLNPRQGITVPCRWDPLKRELKTMTSNYTEHLERTLLFTVFFSQKNAENLQTSMRYYLYQYTHVCTGAEDYRELLKYMFQTYLEFAQEIDEESLPIHAVVNYIRMEVARLNEVVLKYAVRQLVSAILAQQEYLHDRRVRNEEGIYPQDTSIVGTFRYRSPQNVLTGYDNFAN